MTKLWRKLLCAFNRHEWSFDGEGFENEKSYYPDVAYFSCHHCGIVRMVR